MVWKLAKKFSSISPKLCLLAARLKKTVTLGCEYCVHADW